ncbi:MAG: hypothetical protein ACD_3C00013G0011 [uncultured bacterium (gcode 4)]|uniref:Uncharacterized protein n=1 Tax=uncultured bacterium (gcode 4) TaxID=1234023 RepID=K2G0M3_9BACT|nr:MAG: hypothetical protein ACD_3C00013G0011 [uncultured bacterium (gcode 4)]
MKYASYILSIIWVVLLFNIFMSYSSPSYRAFLRDTKTNMSWVSKEDALEKMNKDQIEVNSKILNSIDKLNESIDSLNRKNKELSRAVNLTDSWEILEPTWTWTINSSWITIPEIPKQNLLDIPKTLQDKLWENSIPKKIENVWIFWIKDDKLFDKVEYTTYFNFKKRLTIYVFEKDYKTMLSNLKMANAYKVKESDNLFWFTFYLNPIKADNKIRFVTLIEWVAIWFEIEKPFYESLKKSLLK